MDVPRVLVLAVALSSLTIASGVQAGVASADPTTTSSTTAPSPTTTAPGPTTTAAPSPTTAPAITTTTSPGPTTTAPGATTTTTSAGPTTTVDVAAAAGQILQSGTEIPPAEAKLLGLIQDVQARMAGLAMQLQALDTELRTNTTQLNTATQTLAAREADVVAADQHIALVNDEMKAAKAEMQARAVAAYVRQPTGELANLVLHMHDPSQIVDAREYYQALVDAQAVTVARYDQLRVEAVRAVKAATKARDDAAKQQQAVEDQKTRLTSLRAAFQSIQQQSTDQASEEQDLLGQVGAQKAEFEAEVAAQQAKSNEITAMLQSIEKSQDAALPASTGFFGRPIPGARITSPFGPRVDPILGGIGFHPGIDFGATMGTPIGAGGDGTVVWAGPNGGYGNCTIVDHGHNMATLYAHQSKILVQVGDTVKRGQIIGLVGSTGASTGPHLHFEVRINGSPVNPAPYL